MPISLMAALVLLLISPSLFAAPCDTAQRGTYLSNVCWLIDRMTDGRETITSFNESNCTVSTNGTRPFVFGVSQKVSRGIFFSRSNGQYLARLEPRYVWVGSQQVERGTTGRICWTLYGKGITQLSTQLDGSEAASYLNELTGQKPMGEGHNEVVTTIEDEVRICGPQEMTLKDSIKKAISNLYTKHCDYQESEF